MAAKLFRGFADPTRMQILLALQGGERRVADLVTELDGSQANISGHLACLKGCGLVIDRPQGRSAYYRLAQPEIRRLLEAAEALLTAVGHNVKLCTHYTELTESSAPTCCSGEMP
ncbi:MAG: metalloregulator ArsR/SmtB family transcription factor [Actinobacteria bacterium]|nr:metalloregulator ArsR/SmtB family transcription factor [Actinomycetota bacterium]